MAKSRSGYKRRYQTPEGEKIPLSERTYQRMIVVAHENRLTIGQWCEGKLRQFLTLEMTAPHAPAPSEAHSSVGLRQREVQIDERLMIDIGRFVESRCQTARQWIRSTLLYCLAIEEERMRGVREQPERFA